MSIQKSINVKAKDSSVLFGENTIIQSLPRGIDIPQMSVTDNGQRTKGCSCSTTVDIETLKCNVSVADNTAVLVNINPPEETVPAVCESLPEEGSITRVTGSTVEGTNNLHFCVHERGKHIQIGQCCLIVEIHVNDQMMEELRAEGTLQVDTKIGGSLVTISWRDLRTDEEEMTARIKVQLQSSLTEQLQAWEKAVLQDLVDNECDKCRKLVSFLFRENEGHLTGISPGCFQLTVVFTDRMKLDRGTSPEALSTIREFLDSLLLTKDLESATSDLGFSITVLDQEVYHNTARFHSSEQTRTITDEKKSELDGLRGDISGETMRQDKLTIQMSEEIHKVVQNALREELAHFRREQTKILREAVEEVLPEIEQRLYEKISGKSQVQVEVEKGDGSSPASSPELQGESTHQEKSRQLVSFVQKSTDRKDKKAPLPLKKKGSEKGRGKVEESASRGSIGKKGKEQSTSKLQQFQSMEEERQRKGHQLIKE
ncbi:uncharacterized protein LOC111131540 isoform X2 [Crassostrea virginica]